MGGGGLPASKDDSLALTCAQSNMEYKFLFPYLSPHILEMTCSVGMLSSDHLPLAFPL